MGERLTIVLKRVSTDGQSEALAAISDARVIRATLDAMSRLSEAEPDFGAPGDVEGTACEAPEATNVVA